MDTSQLVQPKGSRIFVMIIIDMPSLIAGEWEWRLGTELISQIYAIDWGKKYWKQEVQKSWEG